MKESYYFPHDFDPTGDPKIQALIGEYGAIGYGVYWRIVEMLHTDCNHKLPLKQYIYLAIAKQMLTSVEQTQAIINYAINTCELFVSDSDYFWSNRVNSNFEKRSEISEKRSIAGKAGAIAKQNLANISKGKERKGNKSKVNNIFIKPSIEEINSYCKERNNTINAYTFFNHYESNGWMIGKNKMKDWRASIRTWESKNNPQQVKSTFTPSPR